MDNNIKINTEKVIEQATSRGGNSVIVTVETSVANEFEAWINSTGRSFTSQTFDYRLGLVPPTPGEPRSYYVGANNLPGTFGPLNQYLLSW